MRLGGAQKVEAVGLGLAERLLMAEDNLLVVFLKLAGRNEAPALQLRFRGITGDLKRLRVEINAGFGISHQNMLGTPVL